MATIRDDKSDLSRLPDESHDDWLERMSFCRTNSGPPPEKMEAEYTRKMFLANALSPEDRRKAIEKYPDLARLDSVETFADE